MSENGLYAALLKVQEKVPELSLGKDAKGQVAGNRSYRYLTLEKLMDATIPLLNRNGLLWVTLPVSRPEGPVLHYRLIHASSGEEIAGEMPLLIDKENSQGFGSAQTYARRYSLCAVLGIVADEDDDAAKASIPRSEQPTKAEKPDNSRLLTDEERAAVLKAMSGHRDKDMLLRSVGCDDLDALTVGMAWELRRKLGPEASAK